MDPRVGGGLGLGVLRCLDLLHDLVLLGKLHVHAVLDNVVLDNVVLDTSFTFLALVTLQSA